MNQGAENKEWIEPELRTVGSQLIDHPLFFFIHMTATKRRTRGTAPPAGAANNFFFFSPHFPMRDEVPYRKGMSRNIAIVAFLNV